LELELRVFREPKELLVLKVFREYREIVGLLDL
jgi:hypothetical protein